MQIATSGIYTGAARGSFSVQPRVPLTYPYRGLKVVWLSTMFKNQQLQAAYEIWQATAVSASEVTLVDSPIPAAFIAHELQAFGLHLTLREVQIVEQSFQPRFLNEHKHHPVKGLQAMLFDPFIADYVFPDGASVCIIDDDEDMDDRDAREAEYPYTYPEAKTVSEKLTVTRQQARHVIRFLKRLYDEKTKA